MGLRDSEGNSFEIEQLQQSLPEEERDSCAGKRLQLVWRLFLGRTGSSAHLRLDFHGEYLVASLLWMTCDLRCVPPAPGATQAAAGHYASRNLHFAS